MNRIYLFLHEHGVHVLCRVSLHAASDFGARNKSLVLEIHKPVWMR